MTTAPGIEIATGRADSGQSLLPGAAHSLRQFKNKAASLSQASQVETQSFRSRWQSLLSAAEKAGGGRDREGGASEPASLSVEPMEVHPESPKGSQIRSGPKGSHPSIESQGPAFIKGNLPALHLLNQGRAVSPEKAGVNALSGVLAKAAGKGDAKGSPTGASRATKSDHPRKDAKKDLPSKGILQAAAAPAVVMTQQAAVAPQSPKARFAQPAERTTISSTSEQAAGLAMKGAIQSPGIAAYPGLAAGNADPTAQPHQEASSLFGLNTGSETAQDGHLGGEGKVADGSLDLVSPVKGQPVISAANHTGTPPAQSAVPNGAGHTGADTGTPNGSRIQPAAFVEGSAGAAPENAASGNAGGIRRNALGVEHVIRIRPTSTHESHPATAQNTNIQQTQAGLSPHLDLAAVHPASVSDGDRSSNAGPSLAGSPPPALRETFAALDAESGASILNWVHAGSHHAEVGFQDPVLGWVGVRAQVDGIGVHASLVPGSADAAQSLSTHLAGLNAYLAAHHTHVEAVTLATPESGWIGQGMGQGGGHDSGQGTDHGAPSGQQAGPGFAPAAVAATGGSGVSAVGAASSTAVAAAARGGVYVSVMA